MAATSGRSFRLSPFRRLVTDQMHFSQQVPSVTADRRMALGRLVDARAACPLRPAWSVIFAKAFALVARDHPELRQSYMKFPWPRIYEHPYSICTVNIEREVEGENIVLYCLLRRPETRSLAQLDAMVRHHKQAPIAELRSYHRSLGVARIPWPLRHWFWWAALNVFGRRRCHNFGTYCVTSVAGEGAGLLRLIPLLTSTLHYSLLEPSGMLDMRFSWDHRVMDGAMVARVLVELEQVLNEDIVRELNGLERAAA